MHSSKTDYIANESILQSFPVSFKQTSVCFHEALENKIPLSAWAVHTAMTLQISEVLQLTTPSVTLRNLITATIIDIDSQRLNGFYRLKKTDRAVLIAKRGFKRYKNWTDWNTGSENFPQSLFRIITLRDEFGCCTSRTGKTHKKERAKKQGNTNITLYRCRLFL